MFVGFRLLCGDGICRNGVDKKNITGYTEVGFYSLDGICTFTEQEQLQAAINPKRLTYRLQNSDQSKYIHVKFDGKPWLLVKR